LPSGLSLTPEINTLTPIRALRAEFLGKKTFLEKTQSQYSTVPYGTVH